MKKKPKLHTYLKKSLPSYMIPMEIVMITKIPLTIGGKIDVNKLKEDYLNGK
ncbi:acyl-CoA synthetase (AMP-forming)/AMP-acid ligase II [Cytobacillus purgationiresistens]|uniref:Acyl-CoA synthetase (AMP-forming)/AMP-acid ligase II n=1 Tax=Cytobacillus purgationiresistens TaxID=863449 RepID=A0ABU0ANW1_9BACI|nr:acyl-CoA synthetase (AMP-forming)/AMP-acid ligase II [Cytobacillus purgationiresistens]